MPSQPTIVSHLYVRVNDQDIDDALQSHITEVVVDQHAYLPGMFTIRLYDPALDLLDQGPFNLTARVEVFSRPADGDPISLIQGEITALEPQFGEGMIAELVVRGYDVSHRLYREIKSKTYLNVKDSDLASQFAQDYKLAADVEATQTVYDHLYQHNQSDLQFLMQRAWRIGYECYVDGGKLIFRRPVTQNPQVTLTWGVDLISFSPRMTMAEQVEEVIVKGWDVQNKTAITGRAAQGRLYAKIEEIQTKKQDGKKWSQTLGNGSKLTIVDQPVVSQSEADILAAARLDEISGVFVEAEGAAFRRPDIRAGQTVKLEGLGKRFSGDYLISGATHRYTSAGFHTTFMVSGSRIGLLSAQVAQRTPLDRWPGVVSAIVTNTDDPENKGRVKVKYPWMADSEESNWARVMGVGAGNKAGFCTIPAVNDEVLVAFMHGDFDQPTVIGGLWNGQDAPPTPVTGAPQGEKPQVRTWTSPKGHRLVLYDNSENKLEIITAGGLQITLDDNGKKIHIESNGEVEISAQQGLLLSGNDVKIEAKGSMNLQASGQVTVKGTTINLN